MMLWSEVVDQSVSGEVGQSIEHAVAANACALRPLNRGESDDERALPAQHGAAANIR